jgi:outer membrane lipoprotein SlyB
MESEAKAGIHPLVATAAFAVIVLAAVGVAAFTGLLPGTSGSGSPGAPETVVPKAQAPAPAAKKVQPPKVAAHRPAPLAAAPVPAAATPAPPPPICADCGVVEAVQEVQVKGQTTGVGAVAGGVGGAVVGNQFGHGGSKTLSRVLGAVGGAVLGNAVEKNARTTTQYEVAVRMEDGSRRTLTSEQPPAWHAGDKVRLVDDKLQPR